jgi:hypothetical protein
MSSRAAVPAVAYVARPVDVSARSRFRGKRYKADVSNRIKCYALGEDVPVEGIVPAELVELMYRAGSQKRQRILRGS